MPNIKSAKKRVKVIEKKTLRNNMIKSGYKSAIKNFEQALESGNMDEAKKLFSEATHAHPECIFGAVCISLLISRFLQQRAGLISDVNIDETVNIAMKFAGSSDNPLLHAEELKDLAIDYRQTGYILRAVGCTLFCLRKGRNYTQALKTIISSGGDAATNGAIVGAVLGAKYGFKSIPETLLKYLYNGNWVYKELAGVIAAMGIQPPESPFNSLSYQ